MDLTLRFRLLFACLGSGATEIKDVSRTSCHASGMELEARQRQRAAVVHPCTKQQDFVDTLQCPTEEVVDNFGDSMRDRTGLNNLLQLRQPLNQAMTAH